jgi:hypothetical protein
MPFLYPKLFPEFFDCVEETTDDPYEITFDGAHIFPTGMSLKKAMALIWKPKTFTVSATYNYPSSQCGDTDVYSYTTWTISGQKTYSLYPQTPQKMSELACNFSANFFVNSFRETYDCNGTLEYSQNEEEQFTFGFYSDKIYLFNKLYYIPIFYTFGPGENLRPHVTKFYGNVTIDGIAFPIYAPPTDASISASITITTSAEREAN